MWGVAVVRVRPNEITHHCMAQSHDSFLIDGVASRDADTFFAYINAAVERIELEGDVEFIQRVDGNRRLREAPNAIVQSANSDQVMLDMLRTATIVDTGALTLADFERDILGPMIQGRLLSSAVSRTSDVVETVEFTTPRGWEMPELGHAFQQGQIVRFIDGQPFEYGAIVDWERDIRERNYLLLLRRSTIRPFPPVHWQFETGLQEPATNPIQWGSRSDFSDAIMSAAVTGLIRPAGQPPQEQRSIRPGKRKIVIRR